MRYKQSSYASWSLFKFFQRCSWNARTSDKGNWTRNLIIHHQFLQQFFALWKFILIQNYNEIENRNSQSKVHVTWEMLQHERLQFHRENFLWKSEIQETRLIFCQEFLDFFHGWFQITESIKLWCWVSLSSELAGDKLNFFTMESSRDDIIKKLRKNLFVNLLKAMKIFPTQTNAYRW